jgi:hypothetical protein
MICIAMKTLNISEKDWLQTFDIDHLYQKLVNDRLVQVKKKSRGPRGRNKGKWQLYSTLVSIRLSVDIQTSFYRLEENKGCTVVPLKDKSMCTVAIH